MENLKLKDPIKSSFFKYLTDTVKIPICLKCGKLFSLGFPKAENALEDYIIAKENDLICSCENELKARETIDYKKKNFDLSKYYKI